MALVIREVDLLNNKKDLNDFVEIPWKIYAGDPNWVAPLKMAVKDLFKKNHPFYQTGHIKAWIATRDGEDIGRIAAIVNNAHNDYHNEKTGFFGFVEAIDSKVVWESLLETAENYLRKQGMQQIRGPLNPSTNYEGAALVEGEDGPPVLMMSYNPKYYPAKMESFGYEKSKDMLAYIFNIRTELPEIIQKIAQRTETSNKVTYRKLNRKNWDREVDLMFEIYNSAWEANWGFVPMTRAEFDHMAKDLKMILKDELILFTEVDGVAAGFIVGLPDLFQVLHKNRSGKLFPTGIFKLLRADKYITRVRVLLMGVRPEYRKLGLEALMYKKEQENILNYFPKIEEVEMSWILEDNLPMNKPLVRMGARPYRRYRIYGKNL